MTPKTTSEVTSGFQLIDSSDDSDEERPENNTGFSDLDMEIDDTIITPHEPIEPLAGSTISPPTADGINAKETTPIQTDPSDAQHNSGIRRSTRVKKVPTKYSNYDLIRKRTSRMAMLADNLDIPDKKQKGPTTARTSYRAQELRTGYE